MTAFLYPRLKLKTLDKTYIEITQGLWKVKIADRLREGSKLEVLTPMGWILCFFFFFLSVSFFNISALTWGWYWLWNCVVGVGRKNEEKPHVSGHGALRRSLCKSERVGWVNSSSSSRFTMYQVVAPLQSPSSWQAQVPGERGPWVPYFSSPHSLTALPWVEPSCISASCWRSSGNLLFCVGLEERRHPGAGECRENSDFENRIDTEATAIEGETKFVVWT